jgi:PKD repeat protein
MRRFLLILLVFQLPFQLTSLAQADSDFQSGDLACATEITPAQLNYLEQTQRARQAFHYNPGSKTITYVPIQNHVVRRSSGTGGLTTGELANILITLNHYYINADIQFYECGPVNYIDDDNFYDFSSSDEGLIASANDVTDVINIYYFNSVMSGPSAVCGYSRFPPSADRVIMDNSCALNGSTIVHELGHYFSLFHTHGKTNSGTTTELVNGTNCATAGDDVCDTPADPNLSGKVSSTCGYTGTGTDANGQPYAPQVDNIMSYSRKSCRRLITPGQYSRVVFSLLNDRNYLICNAAAPVADFEANSQISCRGTIEFEDRSTSLPSNWLWDFGDGQTSTQRNPVHTYTTPGTYSVSLTTSNSSGSDTETKNSFITVSLPTSPVASGPTDTLCQNETASLTAAGSGQLQWYKVPTGGNPMATGANLLTPPLTSTTTFYVEDHIANTIQSAGPANSGFGGGSNYANNRYLEFDAFKPFKLISVNVVADGAKTRTFELRNFLGLILQDTTVFVNHGSQVVQLNFDVPAQTDLQLGVSVTSEVDLYRNTSGVSYPYQLPGILSITGSSGGSSNYYYFYNWKIQEADCVSARVPVTVNVKQCGTGINEVHEVASISAYPNPSNGTVTLELPEHNNGVLIVHNLLGKEIWRTTTQNEIEKIDLSSFESGIYFITFRSEVAQATKKIMLNRE